MQQTVKNGDDGLTQQFVIDSVLEFMRFGPNVSFDLGLNFIWHGVDLFTVNEHWLALPDNDKVNRVFKALEILEERKVIDSKMEKVKLEQNHYQDDINPRKLPKRVRTFRVR